MQKLNLVLLACLITFTPMLAAEQEALVNFKSMRLELALKLAQATLKSCREAGYQVAVAVVDRAGQTQVLLRDRYAGSHTPETARRKAWTAVSFRADTLAMAEDTAAGKAQSGVRFIEQALMAGGGIPVQAAGSVVGGVGVSGAPGGEADHACALDGLAAIEADLAF